MKSTLLTFVLAAAALTISQTSAAELGMDAPPLNIAKYVKGGPVDLAKGKGTRTYVVEFWATWCPPCRMSIPHLTEIQKKFKDKNVTVIGVSDESVDDVAPFVKEMGDKMDYVVALDDEQKTFLSYMAAFEQDGIPTAFIVDKTGRIVWYGSPLEDLEDVLGDVVAGKFDVNAYKAQQEKLRQYVADLNNYLNQTVEETYSDKAKADGAKLVETCDRKEVLDQLAWIVMTNPRVKHRDTALAMRAVKKAYQLTGGKDPSILETYARALFVTGDREKAIQTQKDAIALATDPGIKEALGASLKEYQGGK